MAAVTQFVTHILSGQDVDRQVVLGPVRVSDATTRLQGRWYFIAVTSRAGVARYDALSCEDRKFAELYRAGVIVTLIAVRPPLVLHDFDDELALTECCAAIWPSEKTRTMYQKVKVERDAQDRMQ